ncbi:hypothetical protein LJ655_10975 [Paraburkholderia sp. MMS20-SJTN17]|uniref:Novel STAND NTPase 1 domain-containing protein n=1 Tax=Paraburkholderia translucens TaxID=2886945 RepID=A0ABS8KCB7_9BURK|nr:hypothetical protein [Paraburkholderia sp. MMS20-SJTN17]MCC8402409.1 hypothetical protein [Paraburkholderia sp. MMS20-SJTN17]
MKWPKHPYPGLRFYRETDAVLFSERDENIRQCAESLLRFGVKILLLQGSSGAGKSSFLRAGLIHYLRQDPERRTLFLGGDDHTIRCTADPLPQISHALTNALDSGAIAMGDAGGAAENDVCTLVDRDVRDDVCHRLRALAKGPRRQLAIGLADVLIDICGQLPGRLVLVLDQAEEVLTRDTGDSEVHEASAAFFYFLERVYLLNIDVRIIISLRTEYYGRFRDELRISDTRLSDRPKHGGVEPYLLRSIRDKEALLRVVSLPTTATHADGSSVYNFSYNPGVREEIVDDLLKSYPVGSVTPVLQVICSALFSCLTAHKRVITHADFRSLGGVDGIMKTYVLDVVSEAARRTRSHPDQWYALLYSLVSRQGGGTLVSLTESVEELEKRARDEKIEGDVRAVFFELSHGRRPLLRGEPPERPRYFSLQHDVLATALVRWKMSYTERRERQKAERRSRQKLLWSMGGAIALLAMAVVVTVAVGTSRSHDLLQEKGTLVAARNSLASFAPRGNFRQSLALLLANLDATDRVDTFYERLRRGNLPLHEATIRALRLTLVRMPALTGQYLAAGLDAARGQVALLERDGRSLAIVALPSGYDYAQLPLVKHLELPAPPANNPNGNFPPSVGFIDQIGPVALVAGYAYYWDEQGKPVMRNLRNMLPEVIRGAVFPRYDFIGGKLLITASSFSSGATYDLSIVYVDAAALRAETALPTRRVIQSLTRLSFGPVFSPSVRLPDTFAYLYEGGERASADFSDLVSRRYQRLVSGAGPSPSAGLDLYLGRVDGFQPPKYIGVARLTASSATGPHQTVGTSFVLGRDAVLFKSVEPRLYLFDVPAILESTSGKVAPLQIGFVAPRDPLQTTQPGPEDLRLVTGPTPWAAPPLAGVWLDDRLRAAWSAPRGLWVVENSRARPDLANALPSMTGPLMTGDAGGTKLQFTRDGNLLLLLQQRDFRNPISVRIWDLRAGRAEWLQQAPPPWLIHTACELMKRSSADTPFFSEPEAAIYQIRTAPPLCPS